MRKARPGRRPRLRIAVAGMLCLGLAAGGAFAQPSPPGPRLAGFWGQWRERTGPLLTEEERLYFRILADDDSRESFLRAFWEQLGPDALERWTRNGEDARRLRSRSRARERTVLLAGKPGAIETYERCGPLRRVEVWEWEPWQLRFQGVVAGGSLYLIFAEATSLSMGSFEPWAPGEIDGLTRGHGSYSTIDEVIASLETAACFADGRLGRLRYALENAISFDELRRRTPWPSTEPGWLVRLRERPVPTDERDAAILSVSYLGAFSRYTVLHGRILLAVDRLRQLAAGQLFDRVTITGDVFQDGRLTDTFSIVHHVAGAAPGDEVALDFYRRLLPGSQRLSIRVADRHDLALLRDELELEVPAMEVRAPEPPGYAGGLERLTRSDHVQLTTFPSIELLPPAMSGNGRVAVRAITTGGPIDAVEFGLAGRILGIDDEPPYSIELPIVELPTPLTASALDPARRPLAEHTRILEPDDRAFRVGFEAVRPGARSVTVAVSLPENARVAGFECRHGRRVIHASTDPPFECPLPERTAAGVDYLAATVELESGESQDDVLFIGPLAPEEVEVQLAELYVSILDPGGRPARGLGLGDVRVWEAGGERGVVRVQPIDNLPLNVAVLMDISSSMGRSLSVAARSAQDFFDGVLAPDDVASLLAFNHDFHQLVPFTGDADRLRYGATGLRAWGATRLHDAMAHALFQFAGRTSRRALIVLSDGSDVGSDFPLEQVTDFAVQAGVVVYPISLGRWDNSDPGPLGQLAAGTGGRAFRAASAGELPAVYRRIEQELRAQYLIVYEPGAGHEWTLPPVELEILRPGYRARDIRRYY